MLCLLSLTLFAAGAFVSTVPASLGPFVGRQEQEEAGLPQDAKDVAEFVSAEAGFKIRKPQEAWTLDTKPGSYGISMLTMEPPNREGMVQFSVAVSAATSADIGALRKQAEELLAQAEAAPEVHSGQVFETKVAGLPAIAVQVEQDTLGSTFVIHQIYLLSQGLQYQFQSYAPQKLFSEYAPDFERALASFAVVTLADGTSPKAQFLALANRCGSEVEVMEDWQSASNLARAERKLIVVAIQAVPGFDAGDLIARGPFMDQDVIQLLEHRFVVLRWRKGMGAPFEAEDVFGMSPSTFGTGFLLVTPAGDVVRQVFLLRGTAVYDVLLDTLQGHPKLSKPKAPRKSSRQDRIEFFLASGQLQAAEDLLMRGESKGRSKSNRASDSAETQVREAWLNFELHRLRRNGPEALLHIQRALDLAQTSPKPTELNVARLLLNQASLLAATGSSASAAAVVESLLGMEMEFTPDVQAEAWLLQGVLRFQAADLLGTEESWKALLAAHPESRWAWIVAAAYTNSGWGTEVYFDLRWPKEDHRRLANFPPPASSKGRAVSIDRMVADAADYLVASQQVDGSWIAMSGYADRKALGDDFDIAATVIGGRALLRLTERPNAQESAKRALDWLLAQRLLLQQQGKPPVALVDYAVWSRAYCIFFLADCLEAKVGEEKALRQEIQECLQELVDRQQPNGGWSYYLSSSTDGDAVPQAISFTTATVVMALERAAQVGCVPVNAAEHDGNQENALNRGLLCLENLRSPEGTFAYFLLGRDVNQGTLSGTSPEGSAARGPSCGLALLRGGREEVADLLPRFEMYVEHLAGFGAERRKALMHAGANGQGSHYLLYDYSTAAEALREIGSSGLPRKLRKEVHSAILSELRACRNEDGSFSDNPLNGTDATTGLALNALLDLEAAQ